MTTCRIIKLRRSAEREIHDNESMYPRCGDGPYERYMTTNRVFTLRLAAPYERYMTTNRGIHAAAAHPNMSLSFSRGQRKCARVFEDRT
ncbi:hypothetical protein TcYC6_0029320 [Trypanosoma cruzi]|nr:hypothetical protein TcYC6_0029320 [Trypanosoma cruzi]